MRVAFLGNALSSVPPLEAVTSSAHDIALVVTRTARPAGRGERPRRTAVAEAAERLGLPLVEVDTVKHGPGFKRLQEAAAEALVVVAYGEILPQEVLDLPTVAPVNVHFSLLPLLRGADPVRRAILDGADTTGVTTMRMDAGLDTGPILLQEAVPILPDEDAGALRARLASLGGGLLVRTLDGLAARTITERPQDDARATAAPKLLPEDEVLNWTEPAEAICRRVRALAPEPGARAEARQRLLKVIRAVPAEGSGAPGTVLEARRRLVVAAGEGAVALEEVLPEGRRLMTGAEFARGRRVQPGEVLF